jgi:hypothetical protein
MAHQVNESAPVHALGQAFEALRDVLRGGSR